jgi:hypothetical protein
MSTFTTCTGFFSSRTLIRGTHLWRALVFVCSLCRLPDVRRTSVHVNSASIPGMFLSRLGELRRATPKVKGAHQSSSAATRPPCGPVGQLMPCTRALREPSPPPSTCTAGCRVAPAMKEKRGFGRLFWHASCLLDTVAGDLPFPHLRAFPVETGRLLASFFISGAL